MSEKDIGHEHTGGMAEFKALLREPPLLISISVVFLLFAVFIIYPFVKILLVPDGSDWIRALTEEEFVLAFAHTLYSSFVATFSAIILGFLFAYGIHYTDMPCKRFFQVVALLPTMAPSVVTGLAFIMLFGRRGFITWNLLHLKVDLYGPFGLWVAQTVAFFPLAYITISGVLKSISPNLELAAQNLGGKRLVSFQDCHIEAGNPGHCQCISSGSHQLSGRLRQPDARRRKLSGTGDRSLYTGHRSLGSSHGRHAFCFPCHSDTDRILHPEVLSGKEFLRNRYGETCRRADPRHHGAACKMASLCILHAAQPRDLNDHRSRIPLCLYRCIRV